MRFDVYFIEKMVLDILKKKKWKTSDYDHWLRREFIQKIKNKLLWYYWLRIYWNIEKKNEIWCIFYWKNGIGYFGKEEMEIKSDYDYWLEKRIYWNVRRKETNSWCIFPWSTLDILEKKRRK